MHIPLIASISFGLRIMLLRNVVFTATDVVGCREHIVVKILALVIVFLLKNINFTVINVEVKLKE